MRNLMLYIIVVLSLASCQHETNTQMQRMRSNLYAELALEWHRRLL
mgnify:CR=1 FL=1